jgi:G3E family GTPase
VQSGEQVPVSVLTGFLGSGKTTILNHFLRQPAMAGALVIVNEFGEIGLDHELIESAKEDTILLQSGCLCCTIRNDLVETLESVFARAAHGAMPRFDRVIIETTGLADPAPILQTLMADAAVGPRIRLDGVIAAIDGLAGQSTLDRHAEAVRQAAVADRLLLTKADLASEDDLALIERRLRQLNPAAPIARVAHGAADPAGLFDLGLYNPATKSLDVQRWLNEERYEASGHRHAHDVNRHDDRIRAHCLVLDRPIAGEALDRWLQELLRLKGPDLLRFKAIVNVAELPGPMVLHGVQHVIYPPLPLKSWPSADRRTRMVFITQDIDERMLRDSLARFAGASALPGARLS